MSDERETMETAVYMHDEKGTRTDVHRPSAINPGDYEYISVHQMRKERQEGQALGGPGGICHHCGKAIVWACRYKHLPSGNLMNFGYICAGILDMTDNRIDHEMVLLKRQAANEREAWKWEQNKLDRLETMEREHPDVIEFLNNLEGERFEFLLDMQRSLEKWGSLTDRQTDAVRRIMKKRDEQWAARMERAKLEIEPTDTLDPSLTFIKGEILSAKWKHDDYSGYMVRKMTVQLGNGCKVWGTVPASLASTDDIVGLKVEFKISKLVVAKDDNYFGYYKRPSSLKVCGV